MPNYFKPMTRQGFFVEDLFFKFIGYWRRCVPMRALWVILICFSANVLFASDENRAAFDSLAEKVNSLTYEAQYAKAHRYLREALAGKDLTPADLFNLNFLIGDVHRASGNEYVALEYYEKASNYLHTFPEKGFFTALITLRKAECYFNSEEFDVACSYAQTVIRNCMENVLEDKHMAIVHLIVGYCHFRAERWDAAIDHYDTAGEKYTAGGYVCELPLVLVKKAAVNHRLGRYGEMDADLARAETLVDSCDIPMYGVILYATQIDILEARGRFREAFYLMRKLSEVHSEISFDQQRRQIKGLENRIEDAERETLRQITEKNEAVLQEKESKLNIALICIALLGVLLFFLVRAQRQRTKALKALAELNNRLEVKVEKRTQKLENANQRITENAEKLKEKNAQMLDFCNIISHNFRGPLGNMVALTELMEGAVSEAERQGYMQHFKPVLTGLNESCNELFESLQVVQDSSIHQEITYFSEAFEKTKRSLHSTIVDKEAEVSVDFSEAPKVQCPVVYLESIFHNLISNAVKYRSPDRKPVVDVKSREVGDEIVLSVRDNGVGLDLERHGKDLFKMRRVFHDHPEAKGFGLFLTKAQVEAIGGRIWAESRVGEGTTFCVAFRKSETTN